MRAGWAGSTITATRREPPETRLAPCRTTQVPVRDRTRDTATSPARRPSHGQLATSTFMDYLLPTVHDLPPEVRVVHEETPSPFTEYGVKGGGEGGRMVAPAALASAVEDALRPLGVKIDELPMTPERVLGWIDAAREAR